MIELLRDGDITVLGRHPYASNIAYVVECSYSGRSCRALYKPVSGERDLWDFPGAVLAAREVAAYDVSEALGLQLVPETVWRDDAPSGAGSLQRWIEDATIDDVAVVTESEPDWLPVLDAELTDGTPVQVVHRDNPDLRAMALLDAILNNADRKGGHLLRDADGALWGVDHGVTFHAEPKLRTVLWGFTGEEIDTQLLAKLDVPLEQLPSVRHALDDVEIVALRSRIEELRRTARYPAPSPDWPAVPWPVF